MAKRHHKRHSRRRRRVGAMSLNPASPLVKAAAVAAGYFLGDTINDQIAKVAPTSIAPYTGYAEAGIGAFLLLGKGKPSYVKTAVGGVLAGAGARALLKKFGIVTGYQSVPVVGSRRMGGYQSVPVVGAVPAQLQGLALANGVPEQLSGYETSRMNGYIPRGSSVIGALFTDAAGSGSGVMDSGSTLMG